MEVNTKMQTAVIIVNGIMKLLWYFIFGDGRDPDFYYHGALGGVQAETKIMVVEHKFRYEVVTQLSSTHKLT
jgi:hypothetical protein